MKLSAAEIQESIDSDPKLHALQNLEPPPDSKIQELAQMSPLDYERTRKQVAGELGIRPTALDGVVKSARRAALPSEGSSGTAMDFESVEPWNESVDGAALLTTIYATIRRFVICDVETARTAALWIAFTWLIDEVQVAPIAMITAPEKRCGKTVLLSLFNRLCANPLPAANISPAAIFRCVEAWKPTLLIDEADAFLRDNEDARGILNSGHTRDTAFVIRVVGDDLEPRRFSTWGAKAIAGIGKQADTLMDRSVVLELRRKLPGEAADTLRHAEDGLFKTLKRQLARWSCDNATAVRETRPITVSEINDRAKDNWEPLFAIADTAGGEWPELSRKSARKLAGAEKESVSIGAELLADVKAAFDRKRIDRMSSVDLLAALCEDDEAPWSSWNRGKPISPRQLSSRLKEFGATPTTIRFGYGVAKGYQLDHLRDAFERYLAPPPPSQSVTELQASNHAGSDVTDTKHVTVTCCPSVTSSASNHAGCNRVTDPAPPTDDDSEEFPL